MSWKFWIDVGGTFTDAIGRDPKERRFYQKVLSSGRVKGQVTSIVSSHAFIDKKLVYPVDDFFKDYLIEFVHPNKNQSISFTVTRSDISKHIIYTDKHLPNWINEGVDYFLTALEEAPILAIRYIKRLQLEEKIEGDWINLGTTKATNALLERKGAKTAFLTTKGFKDILDIGHQARKDLFALYVTKPPRLAFQTYEVIERVNAQGKIEAKLDAQALVRIFKRIQSQKIESVAIAFLNAYVNPKHEIEAKKIAEKMGLHHVYISSHVTPSIHFLDRANTCVVNAYLSPIMEDYIVSIREKTPQCKLQILTSSGGLVKENNFLTKDLILSGPAGGVVGFSKASLSFGSKKAIGFDMGGTSTDVSRYSGKYEYVQRFEENGIDIVSTSYAIETVAAGGGSICHYDGSTFSVGPESAGAYPGPMCYGQGGPLTLTDINLFNGKIDKRFFPFSLDTQKVESEIKRIAKNTHKTVEEVASGFTEIANQKMAAAISQISTMKGFNPRDYLLVAFGGAAGSHACGVASILGIEKILLHPLGGILSAFGAGCANLERFVETSVLQNLDETTFDSLQSLWKNLEDKALNQLQEDGANLSKVYLYRYYDLKFKGESYSLTIMGSRVSSLKRNFFKYHRQFYGHNPHARAVEIVAIRVHAIERNQTFSEKVQKTISNNPKVDNYAQVNFGAKLVKTPQFNRKDLLPGSYLEGPAIISELFATIVIEPGWKAEVTAKNHLVLSRSSKSSAHVSFTEKRDPILLELFQNRLTHIATQMGNILQKSSLSVNVKERRDFSCAILDKKGELIVNAPHIPVHLGAISASVKGLIQSGATLNPGDVYLTNDPDCGGSHLPDLTVITPIFNSNQQLIFFTASRAHHVEIGGKFPGSAYPFASSLEEEGVIFSNFLLCREGKFYEKQLVKHLTKGPFPSRNPQENIADLQAQIAANHIGARYLLEMVEEFSLPFVEKYMYYLYQLAKEKITQSLSAIKPRVYQKSYALDSGAKIALKLTVNKGKMQVDFSHTAPPNPNALNANQAIVESAILYCLRCLAKESIPLNSGALKPIQFILPISMLNPPQTSNPKEHVAIVGGNVELSQQIVDLFFGALKLQAASCGTMNNVIFGNKQIGYYETLCGGSGAAKNHPGVSAVHTHMTNTRLTDIEILEHYYPIQITHFSIRKGSAGKGKFKGGDGIVRVYRFLQPMQVSLLTQRRVMPPFGICGGLKGKCGQNILVHKGRKKRLESLEQFTVVAGDEIEIHTPGGGGYGKP